MAGEGVKLLVFEGNKWLRFFVEVVEKVAGGGAVFGHAFDDDEIGEGFESSCRACGAVHAKRLTVRRPACRQVSQLRLIDTARVAGHQRSAQARGGLIPRAAKDAR